MSKKSILLLVCVLTLLLHAGGLFFLHQIPFRFASFAFKKIGSDAMIGEATREEWVKDLLNTIKTEQVVVKEDLRDLKEEFVPSLAVSFPQLENDKEKDALLQAFPHVLPDFSQECNPDLSFTDGSAPPNQTDSCFFENGQSGTPSLDFPYLESDPQGILAESDHFQVSVEYIPRRLHPGYLFKATLIPKQEIAFKRIRENYFFLIDRSNSIIRGRYFYNKKAVSEGLSFLKPGDRFNILIFDDRVVKLASEPLLWNEENVALARAFLDREGHGGYFASTDISTSLAKIVPHDVHPHEINTAILLSDGDTYLPTESQRQLIGGWSLRNAGKVTLFCMATGSGNNLTLLELLSSFNKGELIYMTKHPQIVEKLKSLLLSLQNPIGKGIVATAIGQSDQASIYLEPKNCRMQDLFKNRPYTLFGCTNSLEDFTLFLQGNYYDRTFDIKKRISFTEARRGTLFLEREWTKLVAQEHYEKYFQDGKIAHLEAAIELLRPLNITAPFTQ